jgi:hypothetical protein
MVASINDIPPEIWDPIVQLACTDGGKTGRSLSLVSRRIRALSHLSRLYSILLLKASQTENFLDELDSRPSEDHRVRYLMTLTPGDDILWRDVYVAVLGVVAPTLLALSVAGQRRDIYRIPSMAFPVLRSLTISVDNFLNNKWVFPCLERLHLHLTTQKHDKPLYRIVAERVPYLTHLCLSGMTQEPELAHQWGAVLGIPYHIQSLIQSEARVHMPPPKYIDQPIRLLHLQCLIFRPGGLAPSERRRYVVPASHSQMAEGLTQLVEQSRIEWPEQSEVIPAKVVVLPSRRGGMNLGEMRHEWEEVVCGRLGAWDVTPFLTESV